MNQELGDPLFAKSCSVGEKGPQKDPKKIWQIQEGCALGGLEIRPEKCVGILSRRRQGFETPWDCQLNHQ